MSEYFRVLEQFRRDRLGADDVELPFAAAGGTPAAAPSRTPAAETVQAAARPWSPSRLAAFAALLERLRALTSGDARQAFVFAGPSPSGAARAVAAGLGAEADRLGLVTVVATLTTSGSRSTLRHCAPDFRPRRDGGDPLPLDFRGAHWPDDLAAWLRRAAPHPDLVLIEATPLDASVDAALLARACSGLVLVAETESTTRQALQLAAEQAHLSRCRTLGIVMYGTKEYVPRWVRGLLGTPRRPVPLAE